MAVYLPNGSTISIASAYATSKVMSAVTNAVAAAATLEALHGIAEGDVLEMTSGWSKLNGRVALAGAVDVNEVILKSINTLDDRRFPPGSGKGKIRKITDWQQIIQILDTNSSGGEQQFTTYSFLEDDEERQIPTARSARQFVLNIADDPELPQYQLLEEADMDKKARAIKISLPSKSDIYYNAIISFNKTPTLTKSEVMALTVTLSLQSEPTRY